MRQERGNANGKGEGWGGRIPICLPPAPPRRRTEFIVGSPNIVLLVCDCAADLGAAYGTAKSGVGVSSMGVMKPDLVMKSIIPVVMAGVLGIYGLIIAVIIGNGGASPALPSVLGVPCEFYPCCPRPKSPTLTHFSAPGAAAR